MPQPQPQNQNQNHHPPNTPISILQTSKSTPRSTIPTHPTPEQETLLAALRTLASTSTSGDSFSDEFRHSVHTILDEFPHGEAEEWMNLTSFLAFVAREEILQGSGLGLEEVGVWMYGLALERAEHQHQHQHEHGKEEGEEGEGTLIACAAIWGVVMGEELWERKKEAIPQDRWMLWIDRLRFVSLREDLEISIRELAAEAAAVMSRVV